MEAVIITFLFFVFLFFIIILFSMIKVMREYERGVIFRLGRYSQTKGPGLIILIPFVDKMIKVSLRTPKRLGFFCGNSGNEQSRKGRSNDPVKGENSGRRLVARGQ